MENRDSREESFSGDIVEAHGLELAGHIGIDHILSHTLVVLDVIFLKWNDGGQLSLHVSLPPSLLHLSLSSLTLKTTLYGTPIPKFAVIANNLFFITPLKAKL